MLTKFNTLHVGKESMKSEHTKKQMQGVHLKTMDKIRSNYQAAFKRKEAEKE